MNVEFEVTKHQGRDIPRHNDCREHGGDHNVEKIISGVERGDSDHKRNQYVNNPRAGNVVVKRFAETFDGDSPRQIWHGNQPYQGREHQRSRGQDDRGPYVSRIARDGGEQCCGKSQAKPNQSQQEFEPDFGCAGLQPLGQATRRRNARFQRIGDARTHFFAA